jgi:hypothetical protein
MGQGLGDFENQFLLTQFGITTQIDIPGYLVQFQYGFILQFGNIQFFAPLSIVF